MRRSWVWAAVGLMVVGLAVGATLAAMAPGGKRYAIILETDGSGLEPETVSVSAAAVECTPPLTAF
jgi:hypothetical protein